MRPLGAAFEGVAAATMLWFILNWWTDGAGTRIVRQQGWSASSYWLVAAVGAVGGLLTRSRVRRAEVRPAARAGVTAADLGLAYSPTVKRPPIALPCLEKWDCGKDGNTGEFDGVPVSVFDMTERIDDGETVRCPTRTIVLIPAAGLPAFTISPCVARSLDHLFGFGGMTFDPANAPAGEADTVRQFGRAVRIELPGNRGPWTPATPDSRSAGAAVRRLITPTLMATLLDQPGWSFQTGAGWLACWRGQEVCLASHRLQRIAVARAIRAALLAAVADPSPVVLQPAPFPTAGQFRARALGTTFGVLLGLVGGSYVAFSGRPTAFGHVYPVVSMTLSLLIVPVGAVVGGLLGYGVGVSLGWVPAIARWAPPAQARPEQKAGTVRRAYWRRGCGSLGFFVGGMAGVVAFFALDHLIWPNNPSSDWRLVLFLILPIGGAIAGIMGGVALGGWLGRRRAVSSQGAVR
jgi:hypothetical protein